MPKSTVAVWVFCLGLVGTVSAHAQEDNSSKIDPVQENEQNSTENAPDGVDSDPLSPSSSQADSTDEKADIGSPDAGDANESNHLEKKLSALESRIETLESRNMALEAKTAQAEPAEPPSTSEPKATSLTIPEFGDASGFWGKLGLDYRARPEFRGNKDFDSDANDNTFKVGQRARIGVGLNFKHLLKTFVQFQDARVFGFENTSVSNPSSSGTTDLHQAWAEINIVKDTLALKVGRQQLVYGDQRLIGHLEWLDRGRVFDAAVVKYNYGVGQVAFFEAIFTPDTTGNLLSGMTHFFGAYDSMKLVKKMLHLDFYIFGLIDTEGARVPGRTLADNPDAPADDATPEEIADYETALAANQIHRQEVTFGTRVRLDHRIAKAGVELAGQMGKADSENDIKKSALAFHVDVGAVLPVAVKPRISFELNLATGDKDSDDDKITRFNNLFPSNHMHYGFMDLASWSNALNFAVRTGLSPVKFFKINFDYWLLAKATDNDGWYNASGVAPAGTTAPGAKLLGHELDLTLKFLIAKPLKIIAGASLFIPTATLADPEDLTSTRDGDVQSWAYAMLVAGF